MRTMRVYGGFPEALPKVLSSKVECTPASSSLGGSQPPPEPKKKGTRRKLQPILPLLQTLEFDQAKFKEYPEGTSVMVNQLANLFTTRSSTKKSKSKSKSKKSAAKAPTPATLNTLVLERCVNLSAQDVAALRQAAENVSWDGTEMLMSDEEDDDDYEDEDDANFMEMFQQQLEAMADEFVEADDDDDDIDSDDDDDDGGPAFFGNGLPPYPGPPAPLWF